MRKIISISAVILCVLLVLSSCKGNKEEATTSTRAQITEQQTSEPSEVDAGKTLPAAESDKEDEKTTSEKKTTSAKTTVSSLETQTIKWDSSLEYAEYSKIHTDSVKLYRAQASRKNKVICVNAGHGTKGGASKRTQCHPDGSPKVTGGSTGKGSTTATAVAGGMTFKNGTPEAKANLSLAKLVKDMLLDEGYDVLMIREDDDVQLDNIARTVLANNYADAHIALHYDSTSSDKGLFYLGVPDVKSYRNMEPVKSHWKEHEALGKALVKGAEKNSVKLFSGGRSSVDLTQTSYSTVPSIDLEVGDSVSDIGRQAQTKIARGVVDGINIYFQN